MRRLAAASLILLTIGACTKHDPILPGLRTSIFDENQFLRAGVDVPALPQAAVTAENTDCPYRQDSSNIIWDGDKKIFSGFPTSNSVKSAQQPVCAGNYVIAGLTTGEVVKVNPRNRQIAWIADVFRPSNMTGGASVLDIVAPVIVNGDAVYAGGMGDAFCRINLSNGNKKWCAPISVSAPFIIAPPAAFVMGTNGTLYAVRLSDGAVHWQRDIGKCDRIEYRDSIVTACRKKINAATGEPAK